MESLENKLERLTPEQRKETEDFVDFLLSRSGNPNPATDASGNLLPALNAVPPPLAMMEPVHTVDIRPDRLQGGVSTDDRIQPAASEDVLSAPFQEIDGGIQDRISHDYMDYGQFETQSSPATEAVKKVRRKIIAKEDHNKPHHLLDWVD